jgi:hypothetical protein
MTRGSRRVSYAPASSVSNDTSISSGRAAEHADERGVVRRAGRPGNPHAGDGSRLAPPIDDGLGSPLDEGLGERDGCREASTLGLSILPDTMSARICAQYEGSNGHPEEPAPAGPQARAVIHIRASPTHAVGARSRG